MASRQDSGRVELARLFGQLSDDAPAGELNAAVLVNRALEPDLDVGALRERVEALTASCDRPDEPWRYLHELGFAGAGAASSMLPSSRLDFVLERRQGIPISLGVLLIHLARSQGLSTWGVNFPGHFLVRVEHELIDPLAMAPVTPEACLARLPEHERAAGAAAAAFARAPARQVALRMLNNLKYQLAADAQWHRALDMLDFQLALTDDDGPLLYERAGFWLQAGAPTAARASLERCLERVDVGSELGVLARRQLEAIGGQRETLH